MTQIDTDLNERTTILVVDDDLVVQERLREILHNTGYRTEKAVDGKEALDVLARNPVDMILLDLQLPRISGMDVLRRIAATHAQMPVIIFSGKGTIKDAVEAARLGIYDFLEKPVDRERILITVRNAVDKIRLQRERDRLREEAQSPYQMVGASTAIQALSQLVERAARTESKVLITGESGAGKEVVAHAIHRKSSRSGGPFVAVNCAAIPEELIESELFGYEKGAFTSANQAHRGKFEQASGGTLFLDEIGDMSPNTQAKILRALEIGAITPLGGKTPRHVDVRLIAATNKDLPAEVQAGAFRSDLYWRLNVVHIHVPSLRERREDIPALIEHFLLYFWKEEELPLKHMTPEAQALMVRHTWPGNIRELRNVVERLIVLGEGESITADEVIGALNEAGKLSPPSSQAGHPQDASIEPLQQAVDCFERAYILQALIAHDWKRQDTAAALHINRTYLWRKMQRYHIDEPA